LRQLRVNCGLTAVPAHMALDLDDVVRDMTPRRYQAGAASLVRRESCVMLARFTKLSSSRMARRLTQNACGGARNTFSLCAPPSPFPAKSSRGAHLCELNTGYGPLRPLRCHSRRRPARVEKGQTCPLQLRRRAAPHPPSPRSTSESHTTLTHNITCFHSPILSCNKTKNILALRRARRVANFTGRS